MVYYRLDWQLQFVRIREDFNANFVRSFPERGIDGVAYSLPDAKDGAAELGRRRFRPIASFGIAACNGNGTMAILNVLYQNPHRA